MGYIYRDGEPEDITISFENPVHDLGDYWLLLDLVIKSADFEYRKKISLDVDEIPSLLKTFEDYRDGKIKEYLEWETAEHELVFFFAPKNDTVTVKKLYAYPGTHMTGFYYELYEEKEYMCFHDYLDSLLKKLQKPVN